MMGDPMLEGAGATVTSTSADPLPMLPPDPAKATYAITFGGSGGSVVVVVVGPLAAVPPLHAVRAAAVAARRTALVVLADREGVRAVMRCSVVMDDRS